MEPTEKIARSSLHVEVADRVRDMIFDRTLAPGHRIEELDLSARLGTSRTPLREALKVLAQEGLIRLTPGRGAFVAQLEPREIDALFPVLSLLEARCAVEAVRRKTATDMRGLESAHEKMEACCAEGDSNGYHRACDELHHRLHVMAANPWLLRATRDLRHFLRLMRAAATQPDSRLLHSLAEHRTLMKAIARGDAESAGQIMQHHLLSQQKAWRRALLNREREGSTTGKVLRAADGAASHAAAARLPSGVAPDEMRSAA